MGSPRRGVAAALLALPAFATTLTLPVAATPVLLSQTSCAGDDCDSDTQTWGSCTQGELAGGDPDVWESGPVTGKPYLDFHGERTWILDPSPWMGSREPIGYNVYLSLNALPAADGGGGFAQSAGNLAEITPVQVGGVWQVQVLNDTCAQYFLRVVLTYPPVVGGGGGGSCSGG